MAGALIGGHKTPSMHAAYKMKIARVKTKLVSVLIGSGAAGYVRRARKKILHD
jgi:hypothetical protein